MLFIYKYMIVFMIDTDNIDFNRREKKEWEDYIITSQIFSEIFPKVKTEKTEGWSVQDMDYSAYCYNVIEEVGKVEIKSRNQDTNKYTDLPLKVNKYCNMIDLCTGDTRCIYVVLLNESEFLIFDLKKLDLGSCTLRNWEINTTQYVLDSEKAVKQKYPTLFIPKSMAVYNGKYIYNKTTGKVTVSDKRKEKAKSATI